MPYHSCNCMFEALLQREISDSSSCLQWGGELPAVLPKCDVCWRHWGWSSQLEMSLCADAPERWKMVFFQMFWSSPLVQIYAYRKKIKIKEYSCTCNVKQDFLPMHYNSCYELQVLQSGAGKWLWRDFLLLNVEFPFIPLKVFMERQELVPNG